MDQDPFKTKKFKSLKEKWYKKLEKSGFEDIEDNSLEEPLIKDWHSRRFKKWPKEVFDFRLKYYADARSLLHTYAFESELHKRIWELHSEGWSLRDIEQEIGEYKKDTINHIIHKIKLQGMPG